MVMSSHEVLCEGSIVADHLNTDWDLGPENFFTETDPDPG